MAKKNIPIPEYDTTLMFSKESGEGGMPENKMPELLSKLEEVKAALMKGWQDGSASFFRLPDDTQAAKASAKMAKDARKHAKTLIVSGIGGSDLGSRAILSALLGRKEAESVRFIGANTDPEELASLLDSVDLKKSVFNIVSKSGGTIEPMAAFLIFEKALLKAVGSKRISRHIIATTSIESGALHEIAVQAGYAELPIPVTVGGRFSALTSVGLFPAEFAGISGQRLIDGARAMRDGFMERPASENGPLLFAGLMVDAAARREQTIDVLMPYSEALRNLAFWFRQLWAESLGKEHDRSGRQVHRGLTPIAALGATDQHSQLQLYNEGPKDKVLTFIEVSGFRKDMRIPSAYPGIHAVSKLGGHMMSDLIHAEREATAKSLASHGRPSGTIRIEKITPESIGALMMFFMIATAAAAELLDVDAYDQPGVEEGKKLIDASLASKKS